MLPKPKKVLIVEDDSIMVFMLQMCYEPLGFVVAACVETAEAALDFLFANPDIDLISMDITLSTQKTGVEAAHEIRAAGIETPIFFISGSIEYLKTTKNISNSSFIEKPTTLADIAKLVSQTFGT
jgi:CheY-like chemotaxis protein